MAALTRALALQREEARQQQEDWLDHLHRVEAACNHYTQLFDDAPTGYALLDDAGVVRELNRAGAALLGYHRDTAIGKPLLVMIDRRDTRPLLSHLAQCRATGEGRIELRVGHQMSKAELLTRKTWSAALNGLGFFVVMTDAATRDASQDALRHSEKQYREIVETATEGICIADAHNHIIFANRRFASMVGARPEELIGSSALQFVPREDRAQARIAFAGRVSGVSSRSERRLKRLDGSIIWTSVSTSLLQHEDGTFSGMVRMYTDISERKHGEAVREELVRQLVAAQEAERRRVARELHDQMGQHIVGFSLGLKRLATVAPGVPGVQDVVRRLQDLAEVMSRDVHHLAMELRPAALDDLGLAVAICNYADDLARRFDVVLDVHCDENTKLTPAAETAIYRIAQEGLTNVVKHSGASRASVILEQRPTMVQLIIEDEGMGFDAEELLQFGSVELRLGLGGMMERATLIGGTLKIESAIGRGTTLYLRVPFGARETEDHEEATIAAG